MASVNFIKYNHDREILYFLYLTLLALCAHNIFKILYPLLKKGVDPDHLASDEAR